MAKNGKSSTPVAPNFRDVDAESVTRAASAIQSGQWPTLKVPKSAKVSQGKKGDEYRRWSERVTILSAYRTTAKSGLMDVVVIAKVRQSDENTGGKVAGHYYINNGTDISDDHGMMNDRSHGSLITLLQATGYMPKSGGLKGTLLDKMFPEKNAPGTTSPLNGKAVIANITQSYRQQKDVHKKPMVDSEGDPIMETRDNIESFLPDAPEED